MSTRNQSSRPVSERIPAGVNVIDLRDKNPGRHIELARTISARKTVRGIIAIVESLQRAQPDGAISCPIDDGRAAVIRLLFRAKADARPLARATIADNGCGSVSFAVHGERQPQLAEAGEAHKQLEALLHKKL